MRIPVTVATVVFSCPPQVFVMAHVYASPCISVVTDSGEKVTIPPLLRALDELVVFPSYHLREDDAMSLEQVQLAICPITNIPGEHEICKPYLQKIESSPETMEKYSQQ